MKLFSKKRSLAVCAASVALAAAVLLTGCGGSDGGGGGSTPTPNPNPVEPVEPEEPDNEWKDVAVPGETVKTENVTMEVEKTNVASNTQVDSEDTRFAYAPFNFKITNTTDQPVDLKETLVQPQSVCNAIALFSADDVDYKNEFNNGHASEHLTVTLKGQAVVATVQIHVYNGLGVEQPNTTILQEKDWYGTFDVVAKVPADWAQKDEPLKVNYNLPAQTGVAEIKADFAVTRDGDKVKAPATLAFKADSDGTQVQKLNSVYVAVVGGTVTNQSETTVADISDFLNAEEYNALQQVQNEYAADYMKTHENCTVADVQESLVKYIVEIAGENDEKYPFYQYFATSIETRNTAKVLVKFKGKNAKKSLNPGDSADVTIYIMSTTAENATLRYNNSALLAVDEQEFKNASSENEPGTGELKMYFTGHATREATLNGVSGKIVTVTGVINNQTKNDVTFGGQTLVGVGGLNANADTIFLPNNVNKIFKANTRTTKGQFNNKDLVIALDNNSGIAEAGKEVTAYAFCFIPDTEGDWGYLFFLQGGIQVGAISRQIEGEFTGNICGNEAGFKAIGNMKDSAEVQKNIARYEGLQIALGGYRKADSDTNYDYIMAMIQIVNTSSDIYLPLENVSVDGSLDLKTVATSGQYKSTYISLEAAGYQYGVVSRVIETSSAGGSQSGADTMLAPSTSDSTRIGLIFVAIQVPKDWDKPINIQYKLPIGASYKYARFFLTPADDLDSDSSGGEDGDTDYTPSEDAVNVDLSDSRLSWTFAGKVENALMVNNWSVSNAYSVKANEEGKFALNDVVQYSDVENFMQTYAKNHASEYGSKDGTLDVQALAERAIQAALKEGFECKSVKAMVDGVAYPVIACVRGTYEVRNDYSVVVCFMAALPKDAKVYNVKYVCGTTELGSASYANGSGNTASQKLASLFRAVK